MKRSAWLRVLVLITAVALRDGGAKRLSTLRAAGDCHRHASRERVWLHRRHIEADGLISTGKLKCWSAPIPRSLSPIGWLSDDWFADAFAVLKPISCCYSVTVRDFCGCIRLHWLVSR